MKSVFISRFLDANSPFLERLSIAGWEVKAQSLVKFEAVDFDQVPQSDWIFFYSKTAVDFFAKGLKQIKQPWPNALLAALGPGTAAALFSQGQEVHFSGTGHPDSTAKAFKLMADHQTVLFPQATQSRKSIAQLLGSSIQCLDLVVYDNQPCWEESVPETTVAVLTSPLNAEVYLALTPHPQKQLLVAIGNSTASTLIQSGCLQVHIAPEPTETALAEVVLKLNPF